MAKKSLTVSDNPFIKFAMNGEKNPQYPLLEGAVEGAIAFLVPPEQQKTNNHTLVIPCYPHDEIMEDKVFTDILEGARYIDQLKSMIPLISQVVKHHEITADNLRVVFNSGFNKDSNQTMPYIHAHVLGVLGMNPCYGVDIMCGTDDTDDPFDVQLARLGKTGLFWTDECETHIVAPIQASIIDTELQGWPDAEDTESLERLLQMILLVPTVAKELKIAESGFRALFGIFEGVFCCRIIGGCKLGNDFGLPSS